MPQCLSRRIPGVCARSLTFQLALQLETIAFSPDVEKAARPPPPRCHASMYAHGSHAEAAQNLETPPTINKADCSECGTGRAVTHDGGSASQDLAGCGLRVSRGRARTFENKPFVLRPRLEDFSLEDVTDDTNGNACWAGTLERARGGGGREGRRPKEGGREALGRVDAPSNVGHSRGGNMSASPAPYGRLGGDDAGPRQLVPPNAVDIPARQFGNGDMVMVANLLAHPESLLKVSGGKGSALPLLVDGTPYFDCLFFVFALIK